MTYSNGKSPMVSSERLIVGLNDDNQTFSKEGATLQGNAGNSYSEFEGKRISPKGAT
jgi:hypothetical protein